MQVVDFNFQFIIDAFAPKKKTPKTPSAPINFTVGEVAFVNTDNDFKFYDASNGTEKIDSNRTNHFNYLENVNAAYANYSRKLNSKWSTELGLRAEQTSSKGTLETLTKALGDTTINRNYLNLFPNLGLSYQPSWKHGFALSFSRRIQRPDYQQLNPFENKLDELTYQKGNAFLQPQELRA